MGTFSAKMAAFLAFSIPALIPIACRFLWIGDTLHMAMGVMTLLFGVLAYRTARRNHDAIVEAILSNSQIGRYYRLKCAGDR